MNAHTFFTACTMCGKTDCHITVIDDETAVCDECLDFTFTQCDECGEYWDDSCVEFFLLKNEMLICMHCMENHDEDELSPDN